MKWMLLLWLVACGDNEVVPTDPFVGLVQVSGLSPFGPDCNGNPQGGMTKHGLEAEPSLVVDPANPHHLIGAWQQDRWSTGGANGLLGAASMDGGKTWTQSTAGFARCQGGAYERATDPWLAITPAGPAYEIGIGFDNTGPRNAVLVSRSTDGGLSWATPEVLQQDDDPDFFNDKDSITADPTMPDRAYATWDRLTGLTHPAQMIGTGPTMLSIGVGGVWDTPRGIFDPGVDAQTIGNVFVVLPDGTLVDSFTLIGQTSAAIPTTRATVIRSTDHGVTWSGPIDIAAMAPVDLLDAKHDIDIRSGAVLPQVAVDPVSGQVYVVWEDGLGGSVERIVMSTSTDAGLTWSAPVAINPLPTVSAFGPTIAVATDGTVGVVYYDTRDDDPHDQSTFLVTAWLPTSHDHGATWSEEPLTSPFDLQPSQLGTEYFLGDYQGLSAAGAVLVPFVAAAVSGHDPTDIFVRPVP